MAEDRFANIFTASITMSAANTLTFTELNFGIQLRDKLAIVIDELYWYPNGATIALMTAVGDSIDYALTQSSEITDIYNLGDRRIIYLDRLFRMDFGTPAAGQLIRIPLKESFAPPTIVLPTRMFLAMASQGLASAGGGTLRMHYRTVTLTEAQQLREVLETLQMSN